MDLQAVADELYALPPEDFTATRNALAKQAPTRELREEIKQLRRPSVAAWVVNSFARAQPELLDQLLSLGPALATAQHQGRGQELRDLSEQRRALVSEVVAAALDQADRDVGPSVRQEVADTLEAALVDPATADAVRSGHLVRALSFAGFGGVDLDGAVAVPKRAQRPPSRTQAKRSREDKVVRAEQAALDAAAALDDAVRNGEQAARAKAQAEQEHHAADVAHDEAEQRVVELERELARARKEADAAERRAERTQTDLTRATRELDRAHDAIRAAQAKAERARTDLDRLRRDDL